MSQSEIIAAYESGKIKAIPIYELDYDHEFIKLDNNTVYDMNDNCAYAPQTGTV